MMRRPQAYRATFSFFAALQRSQDNKEGGPDMIGLHPTQSGVSDERDDLNTVE